MIRLKTTLATIALSILATGVGHASKDTYWNSYDPESFFTKPDDVDVTRDQVSIEKEPGFLTEGIDVYLIPVSNSSDLSIDFDQLILGNVKTGEKKTVKEEDKKSDWYKLIKNRLEIQYLGLYRQFPVARIQLKRPQPISIDGESWGIDSYELTARFPKAEKTQIEDTGLSGDGYTTLLKMLVASERRLPNFSANIESSPQAGPTQWQPEPHASPLFPWQKIPIERDGFVQIDKEWFLESGITAAHKPENIRLYADGREIPFQITQGEGRTFENGAAIVFYGKQNDSHHTKTRFYYLASNTESPSPQIVTEKVDATTDSETIASINKTIDLSDDQELHTEVGSFLTIKSMEWLGKEIDIAKPQKLSFDLPNIVSEEHTVSGRLVLLDTRKQVPRSVVLTLKLGDEQVGRGVFNTDKPNVKFEFSSDKLTHGAGELTLIPESSIDANKLAQMKKPRIAEFSFQYNSELRSLDSERLSIDFSKDQDHPTGSARIPITGFPQPENIFGWDVKDPFNPVGIALSHDKQNGRSQLTARADVDENSHFLFQDMRRVELAPLGVDSKWQDWRETNHSADVVIVYHPMFEDVVQRHVKDLESNDFQTVTASTTSIYESFSHGELGPDAIRNFLAYAVYEWEGSRPHSVILYGDATGDGRNVSRMDVPNLLPSPVVASSRGRDTSEFASDSWYTWLSEGDELADVFLGRISVAKVEEAEAALDKIIAYRQYSANHSEWGNRLVSVADRGEFAASVDRLNATFVEQVDTVDLAAEDFPWEDNYYIPLHLLSRDSDAKVSPLFTSAIEQAFNDGAAIMTYFGHGAPNLWSNQRFWFGGGTPNSDILRLNNGDNLPLVTSFTCNNSTINYPIRPWNVCIAEDFIRQPDKGAIATFMPSGPGYLRQHEILARGFFHAWAEEGIRNFGVLAEAARASHQGWFGQDDHSRMYILLGDPTLELPPIEYTPNREPVPIEPVIAGLQEMDSNRSSDPLRKTWALHLADDSTVYPTTSGEKEISLKTTLTDAGGTEVFESIAKYSMKRRGDMIVKTELEAPAPGVYRAEFSLPVIDGERLRSSSHTTTMNRWVSFGNPADGLQFIQPETTFNVSNSGSLRGEAPILVVNTTDEPINFSYHYSYRQGNLSKELKDERRISISPHDSISFTLPLPELQDVESPLMIDLSLDADDNSELPDNFQSPVSMTFQPQDPVDLVILSESIKTHPPVLSDGLTLFIEGRVVNRSDRMTRPTPLHLYRVDDKSPRPRPLKNLVDHRDPKIPALLPGAYYDFRYRWDPIDNAGDYDLKLVVDPHETLFETNRENNSFTFPVSVNTKWDLDPRDIEFEPGSKPDEAFLIARIDNKGETDSGPIAVRFYRTQEASEDNLIVEKVIDGVPANGMREVRYLWNFTAKEIEAKDTNPSYTVALKGSLLRVSSVSGDNDP